MRSVLFIVFAILIISSYLVFAYSDPDAPETIEAAQKALKRLGPNRGSIKISGSSLKIIGIPESISGSAVDLNRELKELGAEKVGEEVKISLSGDVLFDFDSWKIKKEAEDKLRKLAKGIRELGWKHIIIEGHTDSIGTEEYNLRLSQKRANAVKEWFINKAGLKDLIYETKGYGESKPVAPNQNPDGSDNPEGRAKNRRVEIRLIKS